MKQEEFDFLKSNLFSPHFLKKRIQDYKEWKELDIEDEFEETKRLFTENKSILEDSETETQTKFINKLLDQVLDHYFVQEQFKSIPGSGSRNAQPDYVFLNDKDQHKRLSKDEYFDEAYIVADAKTWERNLDSGKEGRENPSYQIYDYVDRTRIRWGVLTNGRKWRLYSYEDCDQEIYLEIDLVDILTKPKDEALEKFKYFYILFHRDSFLPKGQAFIDRILEESKIFEKELQENLEDRVYSALRFTAQGFLEREENNLSVEEDLDEVYENSLIFLYRLLFIFYAEDRNLLPIYKKGYRRKFSFLWIKEQIRDGEVEGTFTPDDWLWNTRVADLFDALKEGRPNLSTFEGEEYSITAYNGKLFDNEEHQFLDENKIQGDYLLKIFRNLVVSKDERGEEVIVDYRDLDIRDLGSVYEGLLEHKLKIADERKILNDGEWENADELSESFEEVKEEERVDEGEVYVSNDSGQRKATGSYYTPDDVVENIIDNTLKKKISEQLEMAETDQEKLTQLLSIDVCDPAMGSGHFLTSATKFLADAIVENVDFSNTDYEPENEIKWAKRRVVRNCIYGVDLNPLATELAKLSLWIETMSEQKPLNFLDHHLKVGNSIRGIKDFDKVFNHPEEEQKSLDNDRFSFSSPERIKQDLRNQYEDIEELEERSLEDIRKKEERYQEFVDENKMYNQFKQISNIYIYQYFGGDVSSTEYENMMNGITTSVFDQYTEEEWFHKAQQFAKDEELFHWELEFPQVFFKENAGFDVVVGNPPWVSFGLRGTGKLTDNEKNFLKSEFKTAEYKIATYPLFMEKAIDLCNSEGLQGYIVPDSFLLGMYFSNTREMLLEETNLQRITLILEDFWKDADIGQSVVYTTEMSGNGQVEIGLAETLRSFSERGYDTDIISTDYFRKQYRNQFRLIVNEEDRETIADIERNNLRLGDEGVGEFYSGCIGRYGQKSIVSEEKKSYHKIENSNNSVVIEDENAEDHWEKLLPSGSNIDRFGVEWEGDYVYVHPDEQIRKKYAKSGFEVDKYYGKKIFVRQTGDNIVAAFDDKNYFCLNNMHVLNVEKFSELQVTAILNSKLLRYYYETISLEKDRSMAQTDIDDLENLPLPDKENDRLQELSAEAKKLKEELMALNLNPLTYIDEEFNGEKLSSLYTCPADSADNGVLKETSEDKEKLRVADVAIKERGNKYVIQVSAKYKPEDSDNYKTTDYKPLFEFHNPSELEEIIIKHIIPEIVSKSGGYAGFYDNTTKNNSISDRFKDMSLPDVEEQEDDLLKFREIRSQADDKQESIEKKLGEMDSIIYELYDLDDRQKKRIESKM